MKKRFIYTIIILVTFSLLIYNIAVLGETSEFENLGEFIQKNPSEAVKEIETKSLTSEEILTTPKPTGTLIEPVTEITTIPSPDGIISNIAGSQRIMLLYGQLVGGVIVSSSNDNSIPTFNPLTQEVITYNMDLGDTVTIDYTDDPAYQAKMSEGVVAEIGDNVRFTANGDDSLIKIKPTENPSYEFQNGLFEYENEDILEQITTTKLNEANIDKEYETGIKCLTLAPLANYDYKDKAKAERSFSVKNMNQQNYKLCIKKTIYDEYVLTGNRYGLIDLIHNSLKLKAKVIYSKTKPVYESLDEMNDAELETKLNVAKMLITDRAPSSETISKTYISNHIITEKLEESKVIRYHEFSKEKYPNLINIYSTVLKNNQPDIQVQKNLLTQKNKNKFTAITLENKECLNQIHDLRDYNERINFYEDC